MNRRGFLGRMLAALVAPKNVIMPVDPLQATDILSAEDIKAAIKLLNTPAKHVTVYVMWGCAEHNYYGKDPCNCFAEKLFGPETD